MATIKESKTARVFCKDCRHENDVPHETIRAAVDAGTNFPCPRCTYRKHRREICAQNALNKRNEPSTDTLLIAAARCVAAMGNPIFRTQLVIAAWEEDNDRFGLEGSEHLYPDSKRVDCALVQLGKSGLLVLTPDRPNFRTLTTRGFTRVTLIEAARSKSP